MVQVTPAFLSRSPPCRPASHALFWPQLSSSRCPRAAFRATARDFYVSPTGNDTAAGTSEAPFATLERTRDAVRQLKQAGPLEGPVTVFLTDGLHLRQEPFVLTPEDSGTESCPVTYTAVPGAKPIVSGGRRIAGWKKQQDDTWTRGVARGPRWQMVVPPTLCERAALHPRANARRRFPPRGGLPGRNSQDRQTTTPIARASNTRPVISIRTGRISTTWR